MTHTRTDTRMDICLVLFFTLFPLFHRPLVGTFNVLLSNSTRTTALERSVKKNTGGRGGKVGGGRGRSGDKALLQLANFTLGPDATLNTEIHKQ